MGEKKGEKSGRERICSQSFRLQCLIVSVRNHPVKVRGSTQLSMPYIYIKQLKYLAEFGVHNLYKKHLQCKALCVLLFEKSIYFIV